MQNNQLVSLSEEDDAAVPGVVVFLQVLSFLHIMSKDAVRLFFFSHSNFSF